MRVSWRGGRLTRAFTSSSRDIECWAEDDSPTCKTPESPDVSSAENDCMITRCIPKMARRQRMAIPPDSIVRAKAPLRVSFAGGGTDLPHWYADHQGAVFSSTIDRF